MNEIFRREGTTCTFTRWNARTDRRPPTTHNIDLAQQYAPCTAVPGRCQEIFRFSIQFYDSLPTQAPERSVEGRERDTGFLVLVSRTGRTPERVGRYSWHRLLLSVVCRTTLLAMMRRWLTALSAIFLSLIFPLALGYIPYDHWDHLWQSLSVVFAVALICMAVCVALVLAQSAISLTRRLLRGTAAISILATCLGAPALAVAARYQPRFLWECGAVAAAIAVAFVLPSILARSRTWTIPSDRLACASARRSFSFNKALPLTPTLLPLRI